MSGGAASLGVTPASNLAYQLGLVYNSVFPSISNASYVGGLSQDTTDINVMSQLDPNVPKDFYTFNFEQGSAIKLSFNGTVGPNGDSNNDPPGTTVDGVAAGLRYQLYDITGNLIADSAGTPAQQAAYADLTSSTGLSAANGGYYVQVSAAPGTTINSSQSYNFQLYSGTTYSTNLVYSAQTQSFDPNLFVSATNSVTPPSANALALYTNSANLSGTQATALGLGNLQQNSSELGVVSQVNEQNQASYYSFNFSDGNAIKLALNNTTDAGLAQQLRVQLYDSSGNIVADSSGTAAQQQAYTELASGEGLGAANGNYTVKVSYAPGSPTSSQQNYNFQLYSGTTYQTIYRTTAVLPSSTASGSTPNVGVFANSQAQLFSRSAFNTIGETASSAVNIGWISANQSALNVVSQLSHVDKTDDYSLTLQQGNNLKLAFDNQTNTSAARIQILDQTGTNVIADNYGTPQQQQAFAALTSTAGLASVPGQYVVQVGYAPNADTSQTQTYDFQLYSGDSYLNLYKTTASAQTYENAVLSGNPDVAGYNAANATASYLSSVAAGSSSVNIISDLSSFA